jgi:hypothetical protein
MNSERFAGRLVTTGAEKRDFWKARRRDSGRFST